MKRNIDPKVREFFAAIGKKNGTKLREERGSEYFSRIAGMRKKHGRQVIEPTPEVTPPDPYEDPGQE